jgi:hypothetical protein
VGGILQPSDPRPTIPGMFIALLICSDAACAHELETWGPLEELEALACDCGCALQLISMSEVEFVEAKPRSAEAEPPRVDEWLPLAA